jgi:class 3 adenylate cyclase
MGVVEKFIGDVVMTVWGTPVAAEGDAERALRVALDLVAAVTELGAESAAPGLAARAGVVTGEVAVTLGAANEGMVAGDVVNTAARVQSAAEPGLALAWLDRFAFCQHAHHQFLQRPGDVALGDHDRPVTHADLVDGVARRRPVWRREGRGLLDEFFPAPGVATAFGVEHPAANAPVLRDPGNLKPHPPSLRPESGARQW